MTLYREGGVIFASPQILVVDLLTKRIPADQISGIIINNCHKYDTSPIIVAN